MKYILVLFPDGSFQIYPDWSGFNKKHYQPGSRFFRVTGSTTVHDISVWIANDFTGFTEF